MGSVSQALPNERSEAGTADPSSPSPAERAARVVERRTPSARETAVTQTELELDDFEPHDTIPAPPWLDELGEELSAPQKAT